LSTIALFLSHRIHPILPSTILLIIIRPSPSPPLFPYTTLFRSGCDTSEPDPIPPPSVPQPSQCGSSYATPRAAGLAALVRQYFRSEEHTSELQSLTNLVCRLLLEKKKYHQP